MMQRMRRMTVTIDVQMMLNVEIVQIEILVESTHVVIWVAGDDCC